MHAVSTKSGWPNSHKIYFYLLSIIRRKLLRIFMEGICVVVVSWRAISSVMMVVVVILVTLIW